MNELMNEWIKKSKKLETDAYRIGYTITIKLMCRYLSPENQQLIA